MFLLTLCGLLASLVLGSCFTSVLMRDNPLVPDAEDKTPPEVHAARVVLMTLCVLLFLAWIVVTAL